jgi:toxin ParE1/3/4
MCRVRFRRDAEESLLDIYLYTLEQFGLNQAERYEEGLGRIFSLLAEHPMMGRPRDDIFAGLRRHVWKAHVIYYRIEDDGILIINILGAGRDTDRDIRGLSEDDVD